MSNLIICHNFEEFYKIFQNLGEKKKIISNNFFFLKNLEDKKKIKKKFKNSEVFVQNHDFSLPEHSDYVLNKKIINRFYKTENLFFQTIDYYEYPNNFFGAKDLRSTFYYFLNNILVFFKKKNIKFLYFTHTPHTLLEVLLLSIAQELNLKTIFRRGLSIPDLYTYETSIFKYDFINKKIKNLKKIKIQIEIRNFKKNYKKNFDLSRQKKNIWLDYFIINQYRTKVNFFTVKYYYLFFIFSLRYFLRLCGVSIKIFFFFILSVFKNNKEIINKYLYLNSNLPNPREKFENSKLSRFRFEKVVYIGHIQKNYLIKYYNNISCKLDLSKKFIFFPLWFQPSSTLHPFAGRMIDYEISIKMLSVAVPDDCFIYIKESPDIFNFATRSWFKGNFNRRKKFYDDIKNLRNVKIVSYEYKDSLLFDHAFAVCSLCDKFNLISLLRGKPNITFVDVITSKSKNTFVCRNVHDIKNSINKILKSKNLINEKNINDFFVWLSKNSFFSNHNVGFQNPVNKKNDYKKIANILKTVL